MIRTLIILVCLSSIAGCGNNNSKTYYAYTASDQSCVIDQILERYTKGDNKNRERDAKGNICRYKLGGTLEIGANPDTQKVYYKLENIDGDVSLDVLECKVFSLDNFQCDQGLENINGKLTDIKNDLLLSPSLGLYYAEKFTAYEFKGDWRDAYLQGIIFNILEIVGAVIGVIVLWVFILIKTGGA